MSNKPIALPEALSSLALTAWSVTLENADTVTRTALASAAAVPGLQEQLFRVLACSRFAADLCAQRPCLLSALIDSGDLHRSLSESELMDGIETACPDTAQLARDLRSFRAHHMLRIIWRDFCRLADTLETTRDASLLAEACLVHTQRLLHAELAERFGEPCDRSGAPQQLIVVAMGKLGARELNVSSDIDLIFTYPESGETEGGQRSISNGEFFTKLGQGLIRALDELRADGFVFRVDMRLRPYGESGPLVQNFRALEAYYEQQGREWERYALIKARPVTGDPARASELMQTLRPFIYRRYIDFGVIHSLRDMKRMIQAEVQRRGLSDNVKLGSGGIREIEFIGQCFQLIRGGSEQRLQQRELLPTLRRCGQLGLLPTTAVTELSDAYRFLRDTEHAIQGWQDRQTQTLPSDPLARAALACIMAFASWEDFSAALAAQRALVAGHFADLIATADEEDSPGSGLWGAEPDTDALAALGYAEPEASRDTLRALHDSGRVQHLQTEGRERLDRFMPRLVEACARAVPPDRALQRLLPLVEAVLRRSAYLVLLEENPGALDELVQLASASPWIAEQLAHYPMLLDELLDRTTLYQAADRAALANALADQLGALPLTDLEQQMEQLRYFKATQVLRVAACEISGKLPLMQVSDNLTWIAEVIIEHVLAVAWENLVVNHGAPERTDAGAGLAVIGYGKLGGIELSYGSDLDLVFLYDADPEGETRGPRKIANPVFYTRLAQRMIHILEARTGRGQLYEIDMRLRPSGASGLLVAPLSGFERYQRTEAWTWEHQALVRARPVAGDPVIAEGFAAVRRAVLCTVRDGQAVRDEVVRMRARMRDHLLPASAATAGDSFHLKQGLGGIVDIEFMVQYAVLAWAAQHPTLADWSDNIRILETLAQVQLLPAAMAQSLRSAYLALRTAAHQHALQQADDSVPAAEFAAHRSAVLAAWQRLLGDETTATAHGRDT